MDLAGKVALVTGGAIRVGKVIALELASAGADVVVHYHTSAAPAAETVAEIEALGRRAIAVQADVSRGTEVQGLITKAVDYFGRLDVLVNSASHWLRTPWAELTEEEWDSQLAVDLKGPFLCSRAAAPHLAAHGDGAIVSITDLSAFTPFPNFAAHSAAKAGLVNLTYSLAMELAPAVRVNAVAPGPILPPEGFPEQLIAAFSARTLLKRWGRPADVAGAVRYLVEADFVTGVVLPVDGGERIGGRKR